jgi:hypothetical protein
MMLPNTRLERRPERSPVMPHAGVCEPLMRRLLLIRLVLLVGPLACGDDGALISASGTLSPPLSPAMLTVTVTDGDRHFVWQGEDFRPRDNATPTTPEANLQSTGPDIVVEFRLEDQGELLSKGSITLPRRTDWRWGVTIVNSTSDPRQQCFGCIGSAAFDLAASHRAVDHDSTWMVWGGNSISNPVTY